MSGSNGSTMAPAGDGNIVTPTVARTPRGNEKKRWFITIWPKTGEWNGSNGSNLNQWIHDNCSEAVWQVERGEESQKLHVHVQMTLKVKKRMTWLKRHMHPTADIEETRNEDKAYQYCEKSETRVDGPYYFPQRVQEGIQDPLFGKELYLWQQKIIAIIQGPIDGRKIYWFWEPIGNVGKSDFCLHLILNYGAVVYDGCKKDILHAHKQQTLVLFDFDRDKEGKISYSAMESLKKGFCFSGKYESGMKTYPKPHMIVFANWPPDTEGHHLSHDRWCISEI